MNVKSESEVDQSCPALSDPMDCSPPGSSIHGVFQARVLEWGAVAFSDWVKELDTKVQKQTQLIYGVTNQSSVTLDGAYWKEHKKGFEGL